MCEFDHNHVLCWIVAIHLAGMISAGLVRFNTGRPNQQMYQLLFYGFLCLSGAATMVSLAVSPNSWLLSSFALSTMILTVTWDCGPQSRFSTEAPPG